MSDNLTAVSVDIVPLGRTRSQYSGHKMSFIGAMGGRTSPFIIWFPVRDRRLARRIARKEGLRFRKVDGEYIFRSKP